MDEHLLDTGRTELADVITTSVPAILVEFEAALQAVDSPLLKDELSRAQVLSHCREIVEKTAQEISGERPPEIQFGLAREIGMTRAAAGVHPNESLRASDLLFGAVLRHMSTQLSGERAAQQLTILALTIHEVLARRVRAAADSYVGVLLNQVHQAQVEERRRISRELHDQIGHGINLAQRDLELFDIHRESDPTRALARVASARRGLADTLEAVRQAITDLRLVEPMESLEKALKLFLEASADSELVRHVEVNGDEAWAPTETVEEVFLIIREALRNTLAHADATKILVRIDIAPDELRASVVDNGQGFDPTRGGRVGGTGILSMRERAALLGGSLMLTSMPDQGTHVELRVPLSGGLEVT